MRPGTSSLAYLGWIVFAAAACSGNPHGEPDSGAGDDAPGDASIADSSIQIDAPPGDIDALPGDIDAPPGDIDAPPGDIDAPPGDIDAPPGPIDAGAIDAPPDAGDPDAAVVIPDAAPPDASNVLTVCTIPPADHTTIGDAIAAAPPGASILVCPGTYAEHLVVNGKPMHILGTGGAGATILDAGGTGIALDVVQTGASGVTLEGFTVRNGSAPARGGGLRCASSTVVVLDSIFTASEAVEGGGGLSAEGCNINIQRTRFDGNDGGDNGGGVLLSNSSGQVTDSWFTGNRADYGGGLHVDGGLVAVVRNELTGNHGLVRGGGLFQAGNGLVQENLISGNEAGWTGGGMHLASFAPTIRANQVLDNDSVNDGGGIYLHQGQPVLVDNVIRGNYSGDDGAGVRGFETASRLERNLIEQNHAGGDGGGARISHMACRLIDNSIRDNFASGSGGGLDLDNDSSWVSGGVISGNEAKSQGGGIHMYLSPWHGGLLEDIRIEDNQAHRGGGIALEWNYQLLTLRHLTVVDNRANHGGGLHARSTTFTLSNSVFAGNLAWTDGGAFYLGKGRPYESSCTPPSCPPTTGTGTIHFVTAWDNLGDDDGSVLWSDAPDLHRLENSIFFANVGPTAVRIAPADASNTPAVPIWRYNDTEPAVFAGMADPTGASGNLAADPLFVDAAGGDFHLLPASPCVDAADPAVQDVDLTRADMGRWGGPGAP